MRLLSFGLVGLALAGCGGKYKAKGPVLTPWERTQAFSTDQNSAARYSGPAAVASPVVPLMAFGAAYDVDLLIMSKHPNWGLHEFGRISTPDGPMWVAKEARAGTMDTYITADVDNIDALMPEYATERKSSAFDVVDRSNEEAVDVEIRYQNIDGETVEVVYKGDPPHRHQKKRNVDMKGIAANQAIALSDMAHRESGFTAKLRVNDKPQGVKRTGLVPFQYATEQAQGGLSVGEFSVVPGDRIPWESVVSEAVVTSPHEAAAEPEAPKVDLETTMKMVIAKSAAQLKRCYATSVGEAPELAGRVELKLKIIDGVVKSVVLDPSELEDEAFTSCVQGKVSKWNFAEEATGTVTWPFVFSMETTEVEEEPEEEVEEPAEEPVEGEGAEEPAEGESAEEPEEAEAEEAPAAEPAMTMEEGVITLGPVELDVEEPPDGEAAEGEAAEGEAAEGEAAEGEAADDMMDEDPLAFLDDPEPMAPAIPMGPPLAAFTTQHRMPSGNLVDQPWVVSHKGSRVTARQESPLRTLEYSYLVSGESLELASIAVYQYGRAVPVTNITVSPALPDLRRPFNGRMTSRYVIDINGQRSSATGTLEAWWTEGGPKVKVMPTAPDWTEDRAMLTTVRYVDGQAQVKIERIGE